MPSLKILNETSSHSDCDTAVGLQLVLQSFHAFESHRRRLENIDAHAMLIKDGVHIQKRIVFQDSPQIFQICKKTVAIVLIRSESSNWRHCERQRARSPGRLR